MAVDPVKQLERLKRRIPGINNDELLKDMLEDAQAAILANTGQVALPDGLASAQVKLAAAYYNTLGLEGQSSHSEGGVSITIGNIPDDMEAELARYRLAKVGW